MRRSAAAQDETHVVGPSRWESCSSATDQPARALFFRESSRRVSEDALFGPSFGRLDQELMCTKMEWAVLPCSSTGLASSVRGQRKPPRSKLVSPPQARSSSWPWGIICWKRFVARSAGWATEVGRRKGGFRPNAVYFLEGLKRLVYALQPRSCYFRITLQDTCLSCDTFPEGWLTKKGHVLCSDGVDLRRPGIRIHPD